MTHGIFVHPRPRSTVPGDSEDDIVHINIDLAWGFENYFPLNLADVLGSVLICGLVVFL